MLGLQLGCVYEEGALVPDGEAPAVVANPVREYVPTTRPGARLPHGWVRDERGRCATLDLIGLDGPTLLIGPSGTAWLAAARAMDPAPRCVVIGGDVADPDGWWRSAAGMEPDGALLVRPDQHVALRSRGACEDAPTALRAAVAVLLGRTGSPAA